MSCSKMTPQPENSHHLLDVIAELVQGLLAVGERVAGLLPQLQQEVLV